MIIFSEVEANKFRKGRFKKNIQIDERPSSMGVGQKVTSLEFCFFFVSLRFSGNFDDKIESHVDIHVVFLSLFPSLRGSFLEKKVRRFFHILWTRLQLWISC